MKRKNPAKDSFLQDIKSRFVAEENEKFKHNISFSFEYFDKSQSAGQDFSQWTHAQILKLIEKLKSYCCDSLLHWTRERIGHGKGHVLEIYKSFPANSDFFHPTFVPSHVEWARFRLEGDMRLIGFVVSHHLCNQLEIQKNIFYIVFLDNAHRFSKSSR